MFFKPQRFLNTTTTSTTSLLLRRSSSTATTPHPHENKKVELEGIVKRVVFRSQDLLFSILSVQPTDHDRDVSVLGRGSIMGQYMEGESLQVSGTLKTHKKYGLQVEVSESDAAAEYVSKETLSAYANVEGDAESMRAYLKNGFIPQVGPATADLLVNHFGDDTSKALLSSKRLLDVNGIGKVKAKTISDHWKVDTDTGVRPSIMYLLSEFNLTFFQAKILLKRYGVAAPDVVKKNPYRLIDDINGVGFTRADAIAQKMGIAIDSNERSESSITHWLSHSAQAHGHTCQSVDDVCSGATSLLSINDHETHYVPNKNHLKDAIQNLERKGRCTVDFGDMVYEKYMYQAETLLASSLRSIVSGDLYGEQERNDLSKLIIGELGENEEEVPEEVVGNAADDVAERLVLEKNASSLSTEQQKAVLLSQTEQLLVMTGGPGTGKTYTTRSILREWWAMGIKNIVLTSPTARAARHLGQVATEGKPEHVEKPKAMTIHKLLEYSKHKNKFMRHENRPIEAEAVVVDECSMLDTVLAASLFSAMRPGTRVLIVGDADQLPSVGPGNVLRDLVNSDTLPVVRLVQIHRQEEAGDIVKSAHQFNQGIVPMGSGSMQSLRPHDLINSITQLTSTKAKEANHQDTWDNQEQLSISDAFDSLATSDCLWIEEQDSAKGAQLICTEIMDYIEARGFSTTQDVQVLSPMHKGNVGTIELNNMLRFRLNPTTSTSSNNTSNNSSSSNIYRSALRVGDRCMQETNDYDLNVWNGECGTVVKATKGGLTTVEFKDGEDRRIVEFSHKQSRSLTLSYACTIHKSQGQEFPVVVVPTYMEHFHMLSRELVYTALTRASKLVIFVGQKRALGGALNNQSAYNRTTGLLRHLVPKERVSESAWRSNELNSKTIAVGEDHSNRFVRLFDDLDLEDLVLIDKGKQSTVGGWEKGEEKEEEPQEIETTSTFNIATAGPWHFESSKEDGVSYTTTWNPTTQSLTCTCPGYKFRQKCKHVEHVQDLQIM
jgi:exodeoxyribonuclease V alpha subunit